MGVPLGHHDAQLQARELRLELVTEAVLAVRRDQARAAPRGRRAREREREAEAEGCTVGIDHRRLGNLLKLLKKILIQMNIQYLLLLLMRNLTDFELGWFMMHKKKGLFLQVI